MMIMYIKEKQGMILNYIPTKNLRVDIEQNSATIHRHRKH